MYIYILSISFLDSPSRMSSIYQSKYYNNSFQYFICKFIHSYINSSIYIYMLCILIFYAFMHKSIHQSMSLSQHSSIYSSISFTHSSYMLASYTNLGNTHRPDTYFMRIIWKHIWGIYVFSPMRILYVFRQNYVYLCLF